MAQPHPPLRVLSVLLVPLLSLRMAGPWVAGTVFVISSSNTQHRARPRGPLLNELSSLRNENKAWQEALSGTVGSCCGLGGSSPVSPEAKGSSMCPVFCPSVQLSPTSPRCPFTAGLFSAGREHPSDAAQEPP